ERTQINYCDGIAIVDRATGERRKTHLFCGVLPFSSFAFAEFVERQKLASFIESHERMWAAGPTRGGGRRSRTGPRPEHWANLQSGRRVRWRRGAAGARAWWRAASGWRATFPEQRRRRNGACRWRWPRRHGRWFWAGGPRGMLGSGPDSLGPTGERELPTSCQVPLARLAPDGRPQLAAVLVRRLAG